MFRISILSDTDELSTHILKEFLYQQTINHMLYIYVLSSDSDELSSHVDELYTHVKKDFVVVQNTSHIFHIHDLSDSDV